MMRANLRAFCVPKVCCCGSSRSSGICGSSSARCTTGRMKTKCRTRHCPGFVLTARQELRGTVTLRSQAEIEALFCMTPYYYKTGARDQAKLRALDTLTTETEFALLIYKKSMKNVSTRRKRVLTFTFYSRNILYLFIFV